MVNKKSCFLREKRKKKLLHCLARKESCSNHVTERETDILLNHKSPHSVWENLISCLFLKLSWQEKHFSAFFILPAGVQVGFFPSF